MDVIEIEERPIRLFPRGTLLGMLLDAYADHPEVIAADREDWAAFDDFFATVPRFRTGAGLCRSWGIVLSGSPHGIPGNCPTGSGSGTTAL